jgi:hypothetical protein
MQSTLQPSPFQRQMHEAASDSYRTMVVQQNTNEVSHIAPHVLKAVLDNIHLTTDDAGNII